MKNKKKQSAKRGRQRMSGTEVMPLWAGGFLERLSKEAFSYSASFPYDKRLWKFDIVASIAHARMLGTCKVIADEESKLLSSELEKMLREIELGKLKLEGNYEDIHSFVESTLTERIGDIGGKLHTARSRNDQVVTDMKLWMRSAIAKLCEAICELCEALLSASKKHIDFLMPGFTHLQHAQPVRLSHHLMAYFWMMQRDADRLIDLHRRMNLSPLGAGALAGVDFPIDPKMTAKMLGFDGCMRNSIDAVSDRDFIVEFISCCAIVMVHLSRLAEELVLWSTPEFGFVKLKEALCTGSSIMPQKRNPDMAELIRARCGRVVGALTALLTVLKGLPLSYNRDLQEDKIAMFEAFDVTHSSILMATMLITSAEFNGEKMRSSLRGDFSTATDLANELVRKGIPFRHAHSIVGKLVRELAQQGKGLEDVTLEELKQYCDAFDEASLMAIKPEVAIERRAELSGTAKASLRRQFAEAKRYIKNVRKFIAGLKLLGEP
ncbi:MAG: argininosuccinate lyase [Armatimonadota bacterium]|nr:argininosuccinate lyase [Armatimonadota bacterium]MCX7778454.1 argininosuccinate lyase [Armatimonadota bacterium]MDW8026525.1 argininosuccinate lyase [Armatimonadota bacterium]